MSSADRIPYAIDAGLTFDAPVYGIRMPADPALIRALPTPLHADNAFKPEADALNRLGIPSAAPDAPRSAIVFLGKHRDENQFNIAKAYNALPEGGVLVVTGQKTEGIEPLYKLMRKADMVEDAVTKAHGRLFWGRKSDAGADLMTQWHNLGTPKQIDGGFWTCPGIFSADKADQGSKLLLEHLPPLSGKVADLGAGWGYLSRAILANADVTHLDVIEADAKALEMARRNLDDMRAHFAWEDATAPTRKGYDWVVSNPPFHTGRDAEPALGQAFIRSAAKMLAPSGRFIFVANRQLPYEAELSARFRKVEEVALTGVYKVILASQPKPQR